MATMTMERAPTQRRFSVPEAAHVKRRMSTALEQESPFSPCLTTLYLGLSAVFVDESTVAVAYAVHNTVYLLDYAVKNVSLHDEEEEEERDRGDKTPQAWDQRISRRVVKGIEKYEHENFIKFLGVGLPTTLKQMSPSLCPKLWLELDMVPIVLMPDGHDEFDSVGSFWAAKSVEEQADSMARKCILHFGPSLSPLLQVGFRGSVATDASFRANLVSLDNFMSTCGQPTWNAMMHYCQKLRDRKVKIAFFSSTPQGGGVALMRHALVRFSRLAGVNLSWYVPKPKPGVFRVTKNIHNILQGVSKPDQRVSDEEKQSIVDWIVENAHRYWLSKGGPLSPPEEGGADVIIIDDPQMPGLIPLIKQATPNRPVLYRSHIQIRSDLVAIPGSPQHDVWQYLWDNIKGADMFISHPIPSFVPKNVPRDKVVYMPATTDWLDGLNKPLNRWDTGYYGHAYNLQCHSQRMTELAWPSRKYIAQVARFDPSKGIPTVIDAYAEFRRMCEAEGISDVPQLCICGNGSIDDPDASIIFDEAMTQLEDSYPDLIDDCSIMRLEPNDQLLNTILSNAHVVLQLSTREGFEVKVSEALHAGRPVIASRAGGIPLQIKDGVNGFLVEPGDWRAVAAHLKSLWTDDELHARMSREASRGVSDEVGTVGNALSWFYLADRWTGGEEKTHLKGNEKWVNDMAREEAGVPYSKGENRLPRSFTERKM